MNDKNNIRTISGIFFSPLAPHEDDINAGDIAHALSLLCRANGHFKRFYSVGQHCIACEREAAAEGLSREVRLACLLHDASEAYISDITRPVKLGLPEYRRIEKKLSDVIFRRFGIDPDNEEIMREVSRIDDSMLYYEFLELGDYALFEAAPAIKSHPVFETEPFELTEKKYLEALFHLTENNGGNL